MICVFALSWQLFSVGGTLQSCTSTVVEQIQRIEKILIANERLSKLLLNATANPVRLDPVHDPCRDHKFKSGDDVTNCFRQQPDGTWYAHLGTVYPEGWTDEDITHYERTGELPNTWKNFTTVTSIIDSVLVTDSFLSNQVK